LAKKQKRVKPKEVPTKRQLSRWQRERRTRRIIISAAAVFLAGIVGYICYGYYDNEIKPLHGIVIEVNDTSFNMDYYVKMLDTQTRDMEPTYVYYMTDQVARYIEDAELMKQGADDLGIVVTTQEIDEEIERNELPNDDKIYRDIIRASLLGEKLQRYFNSTLPDTMEQAHVRVMLVESQEVAHKVIAEIESGGNFTALVEQFSCNPQIEGDLGWLPKELMPNSSIEEAAFSLEPNELSTIYDDSATKSVGYWLIEVTERDEEEGIKARAMLLSNKQEAQEVKAKLDIGGNFTAFARDLSQHPSKNNGGELGWLKQGDMGSEAFDKVAFNLTLNEVSQPVKDESIQTKSGYWIIKLLEKGKHELSEEVRKKLADNDFAQWFEEQRENSTINNYLDEEKKGWAVKKVLKGR
jgi:foldase protein PrsA